MELELPFSFALEWKTKENELAQTVAPIHMQMLKLSSSKVMLGGLMATPTTSSIKKAWK
jgi:hypothetical protein